MIRFYSTAALELLHAAVVITLKLGEGYISRSARAIYICLGMFSVTLFFISIHSQWMNLCPPH